MIIVIVCVVVAAAICGLLLRMAVLGRSSADAQHRRAQAQWLAEAGIERAVARLAQDARYTGETWTLAPQELPQGGRVRMAVETPPAAPGRRLVRVEALYPNDPTYGCRYKKEILVETK
jgi:type II secretory pathway component PulK